VSQVNPRRLGFGQSDRQYKDNVLRRSAGPRRLKCGHEVFGEPVVSQPVERRRHDVYRCPLGCGLVEAR
jgi:hypothetical protein